jgi:hypothetical protein
MIPTGTAGTRQTLNIMRNLARAGKKLPVIRQAAIQLTQGLPQKDWYSEIKALYEFVRDRIRYVRDITGVETLHTADRVLLNKQGDCDDKGILLAALLGSLGHPTRFVAAAFKPNSYSHVWAEVFYNGQWVPLETTEPVSIGWRPANIISTMIVHNDDQGKNLSALAGKRVKKFLAAQAAQVAQSAAAAAAAPEDVAAQERAAELQAQQAATMQSYYAKEATKKHGLAKIVQKIKEVRLKVDPVAKSQKFIQQAKKYGVKEAIAKTKEEEKKTHLKATQSMAKISPSFKKHAKFEEGKFRATELKANINQIEQARAVHDTPLLQEQEQGYIQELQQIAEDQQQYVKQGKIAAVIASIVLSIFTFGGGAGVVSSAVQALKEGAVALAKKLLLGAAAGALAKGASPEDVDKANAAANILEQYPPDPNLSTLDEMITDSYAKRDAAQAKTLGWLVPVGIFLLSALS